MSEIVVEHYKKKMKLAKFISIATSTIIFFTIAWILIKIGYDKYLENLKSSKLIISAIGGIISLVNFTLITFSMLGYSLKLAISAFKFKNEKGLWKILNLVFKIGLLIFAILITIFWLVWFIYILKDGFGTVKIAGEDVFQYYNKFEQFGIVSITHILGKKNVFLDSSPFGLYVTSFVFIIIWSGAGITFEIIKKILGGNRIKRENTKN